MSFETMTRLVSPLVRNAPFSLQVDELREAASAFFQRTEAWFAELDEVSLAAGETEIELDLPSGSALVSVLECSVDDQLLLKAGYSISWGAPDMLRLAGYGCPVVVRAIVALKPSFTSAALPASIEAEYARPVSFGAVSRLKSMSGTEWFDPNGAAIFHEQFKSEMAKTRRRMVQRRFGPCLRVAPVSFM
jgi:hypothetical protein